MRTEEEIRKFGLDKEIPPNGVEIDGVPLSDRENLRGVRPSEGRVNIEGTATKDLINLSEAVGENAAPSTGEIAANDSKGAETIELDVAGTLQDGKPVNAHDLLTSMINSAKRDLKKRKN